MKGEGKESSRREGLTRPHPEFVLQWGYSSRLVEGVFHGKENGPMQYLSKGALTRQKEREGREILQEQELEKENTC